MTYFLDSITDVNAKPLNGRGGGANTRYNALQDRRIMRNVVSKTTLGIWVAFFQEPAMSRAGR